jgi:hypothetical protein
MKFIISSELREEIEELLLIVKSNCVHGDEIVLCVNEKINIEDQFKGKIFKERNFSRFKFIDKVAQTIYFIFIVISEKPDYIFSGNSMFKHRMVTLLFGVKHIAYFRTLFFYKKAKTGGLIDKLRYGYFGKFFKGYLFNSFEATHILTVSELNILFFQERMIEKNKIFLTGPVWLDGRRVGKKNIKPKIIFLTQAFLWHGYVDQHNSQTIFLKGLISYAQSINMDLLIRKHPRDSMQYEKYFNFHNVKFSEGDYQSFMDQIDQIDIVVTPLSTMAFELMHLGARCSFYTTNALQVIYKDAYERLSICPITLDQLSDSLSLNDLYDHTVNLEIFSPMRTQLEFL